MHSDAPSTPPPADPPQPGQARLPQRVALTYALGTERLAGPVHHPLFELLGALHRHGSISAAAAALQMSYRHVWGELRRWEAELGRPLVLWSKGQRAALTPFGEKLLWAERRAQARLAPQIEALRMELEEEGAPISVTLIKPSGIDTPYPEHARNKLDKPARLPQPLYDADVAAKAICFAAEHPRRTLIVGGGGVALTAIAPALPRLSDIGMEIAGAEFSQTTDVPPEPGTNDNLFEPRKDGREDGNQHPFKRQTSLYLEAQMHPVATAAIVGGVAAAIGGAAWVSGSKRRREDIGTRDARRRIEAAGMAAE